MLISVLNMQLTYERRKAIKLNYINTRTNAVVVPRVPSTLHVLPHVKFATPAYVIRRGGRPFYEWARRGLLWTISRMFSCVLIVCTTSLSDCTTTLGRQPVSRIVWWIRENTPLDGIIQSGKTPLVFVNSSTCIAISKSIHKMHVTIFHVGKHKRYFCNSIQVTNRS